MVEELGRSLPEATPEQVTGRNPSLNSGRSRKGILGRPVRDRNGEMATRSFRRSSRKCLRLLVGDPRARLQCASGLMMVNFLTLQVKKQFYFMTILLGLARDDASAVKAASIR